MDTSFDEGIKRTFDMLVERMSIVEERTARAERAAIFTESCKFGVLNSEIFGVNFDLFRCSASIGIILPTVSELVFGVRFRENCGCDVKTDETLEDRKNSLKELQDTIDTLFSGSKFHADVLSPNSVHLSTRSYPNTQHLHEFISMHHATTMGLGHKYECVQTIMIHESDIRRQELRRR